MAESAVFKPRSLNAFSIMPTTGAVPPTNSIMVVLGPFLYIFVPYLTHPLHRLHLGSLHWTQLTLYPPPTDTFCRRNSLSMSSTSDGGALVLIDYAGVWRHRLQRFVCRRVKVHVLEVSCEHDLVHWQTLNCTGDVPALDGRDLVSGLSPANTAYTVSAGHRYVHELTVTAHTDRLTASTSYSAHWQRLFSHIDPEDDEQDIYPWTPPDHTPSGESWYGRRIVLCEKSFVLVGGGSGRATEIGDLIGFEQLHCFDLVLREWVQPWQTQADPSKGYPAPRICHCVMRFEHKLLVCFGYGYLIGGTRQHSDLWSLDVRTRKWQQLSTYMDQKYIYNHCCLSPQGEIWAICTEEDDDDGAIRHGVVCRAKLRMCSLVECAVRALLTARPSFADAPLDQLLWDVRVPRFLVPLVNHHTPVPIIRTAEQLACLQLTQTRMAQGYYYYRDRKTPFDIRKYLRNSGRPYHLYFVILLICCYWLFFMSIIIIPLSHPLQYLLFYVSLLIFCLYVFFIYWIMSAEQ